MADTDQDGRPVEDWSQIADPVMRRKAQNREAQRRRRGRARTLAKLAETHEAESPQRPSATRLISHHDSDTPMRANASARGSMSMASTTTTDAPPSLVDRSSLSSLTDESMNLDPFGADTADPGLPFDLSSLGPLDMNGRRDACPGTTAGPAELVSSGFWDGIPLAPVPFMVPSTPAERLMHVMGCARAVGFESLDELLLSFYGDDVDEHPALRAQQREARRSALPRLVRRLHATAESWSGWESRGVQEELLRAGNALVTSEAHRLQSKLRGDGHRGDHFGVHAALGGHQPTRLQKRAMFSEVPNLWCLLEDIVKASGSDGDDPADVVVEAMAILLATGASHAPGA